MNALGFELDQPDPNEPEPEDDEDWNDEEGC